MIEEFEKSTPNRNECMRLVYESGRFTLNEIGAYFGLHYSSVRRIVNISSQRILIVEMPNSSPDPMRAPVHIYTVFICNRRFSKYQLAKNHTRKDVKNETSKIL
jgi:hypothetical protein